MDRSKVVGAFMLSIVVLQCSARAQSSRSQSGAIGSPHRTFAATSFTEPTAEKRRSHLATGNATLGTEVTQAEKPRFNINTLPLVFHPNVGQEDSGVRFSSRAPGYTLRLNQTGAILSFSGAEQTGTLGLKVVGANPDANVSGGDELPGKVNYLIGRDPTKWHRQVPSYSKVAYGQVLPGIDLVYYGRNRQLEYDFELSPGADPNRIKMALDGQDWAVQVTPSGDLDIVSAHGSVRFARPVAYQFDSRGIRRSVKIRYSLDKGGRIFGFDLGRYDRRHRLVIDPSLVYSSYFGGSNSDSANALAVDGQGNVYIAGNTASTDLPTTPGSLQTTTSAPIGGSGGYTSYTGFVAKFDSGGQLVFATYLGGSSTGTYANGIAVDSASNVIVVGLTISTDFPLQNAAQSTCGPVATSNNFNCAYTQGSSCTGFGTGSVGAPQSDAFVTKLDPSGSQLIYSTYLGGSSNDWAAAVTVDSTGEAYVTGGTMSIPDTHAGCPPNGPYCGNNPPDNFAFPTTIDAYMQPPVSGGCPANSGPFPFHYAWVAKLSPTGALDYSTYFGPTEAEEAAAANEYFPSTDPRGLALDSAGDLYIAGQTSDTAFASIPGTSLAGCNNCNNGNGNYDAWVAEFNFANAGSSQLVYSNLFGGSSSDYGYGIALDPQNNIYVAGQTLSSDFPTTPGSLQPQNGNSIRGFVTKLKQQTGLVYSALLGTNGNTGNTSANAIVVDATGAAVVTGTTQGFSFPLVNPLQSTDPEGFLLRMTADGSSTFFSTFFGGFETTPNAVALDTAGNAYIAGNSTNVPTTVGASCPNLNQCGSSVPDAFVAKINIGPPPAPNISSEPTNPTNATTATFNFTDAQAGVTFLCSLDSPAFSACSSGINYLSLGSGSHTFAVEAKDSTGDISTPTTYTWTINASQTIAFSTKAPASAVYNTSFTVAASASSGLAVAYTSSGACSNSGATYKMTSGTGTCQVIANQAGDSNYSPAPQVTETVNATPASQTIKFTVKAPPVAADHTMFTVAASASSGLPVAYTSSGSCGNSGATYTITSSTGTCLVFANQAGNSNYAGAPQLTETVQTARASQTITFTRNAPPSASYETAFEVAATASSGLPVTFTSSGVCTDSGATYSMLSPAGTCTVIANQAGNATYLPAATATEITMATKARQAVTFTGAPAFAPYQSKFKVTATSSAGITATITSSGACSISGTTVTMTSASGTCTLTANWAANAYYQAKSATQTTTAEKK